MITEHRTHLRPIGVAAALLLAMLLPQGGRLQADTLGPPAMRWPAPSHSSSAVRECTELPSARNCTEEMNFASIPSRDRTGMTFVHRSDKPIKLYWLIFARCAPSTGSCLRETRFLQATFIGHNWLVSTLADQCIGIFNALPNRSRSSDSKSPVTARRSPGHLRERLAALRNGRPALALEQ